MNCRRVVNLMSAYVDGELTGAEMLAIRRHLSECSECEQEHEAVRLTKHAVARLRVAVPRADLAESILRRLSEAEVPRYQRPAGFLARSLHEKLSPVAAALAVAGAALVILSSTGIEQLPSAPGQVVANAPVQSVTFLRELHASSTALSSSKPLKLADEGSQIGRTLIQLTGFGPR